MNIDYLYRKSITISIVVEQRKKSSFMGRFGGGWNWELGFVLGHDLIINLLVMSIRVSVRMGGK